MHRTIHGTDNGTVARADDGSVIREENGSVIHTDDDAVIVNFDLNPGVTVVSSHGCKRRVSP